MTRIEPITFVVGVVPFTHSSMSASDADRELVSGDQPPNALPPMSIQLPPEALQALVRLLARQAARQSPDALRNPINRQG